MTDARPHIRWFDHDQVAMQPLVEAHPPAAFASPDWLAVLARGFDSRAGYAALVEDGRPVVALPGIRLQLYLVRMLYAGMPYGGVLGDGSRMGELLSMLDGGLARIGVDVCRIVRTCFDSFDDPPGYRRRTAMQHLLDVTALAEKDLKDNVPSAIRRNVRKARSAGVEIRTAQSIADMDALFELYRETMSRRSAAVFWPRPFMHALYEQMAPTGRAEVLLAEHEGRAVAGMILLHDQRVTYYFLGASDAESLALRPNDLLFNAAIQSCMDGSRRYFDFMTTAPGDEGLARFKEKWGAERKTFEIFEKTLSLKGKLFWRPVWWLGNSKIGPWIGRLIGLWG